MLKNAMSSCMSCGTCAVNMELVRFFSINQVRGCKLLHWSSGMLKQELYIDNLAVGRTLGLSFLTRGCSVLDTLKA